MFRCITDHGRNKNWTGFTRGALRGEESGGLGYRTGFTRDTPRGEGYRTGFTRGRVRGLRKGRNERVRCF